MHKLQNFFLQKKTQRFVFIVNEQASACLWEFISIWIQLEMNTFLSTIFSKTIFWNDLKRNVMVKQITYYGWITVFKVIFWKANFPIARVELSRVELMGHVVCFQLQQQFPDILQRLSWPVKWMNITHTFVTIIRDGPVVSARKNSGQFAS